MKTIFVLQGEPAIGKDYLLNALTNEKHISYVHDDLYIIRDFVDKGPRSLLNAINDAFNKEPTLNKNCDFIVVTHRLHYRQEALERDGWKFVYVSMSKEDILYD